MICYSTLIQGQDKCARVDQKEASQSEVYKWLRFKHPWSIWPASACSSGLF